MPLASTLLWQNWKNFTKIPMLPCETIDYYLLLFHNEAIKGD